MSLLQPNSIPIHFQITAGPTAFPVSGLLTANGQAWVVGFGGLTKLEWMVGQVAAARCDINCFDERAGDHVQRICDIASLLLQECERRQAEKKGNA